MGGGGAMKAPVLKFLYWSMAGVLIAPVSVAAFAQGSLQWTKNAVVIDGNTAQGALTSVSTDGHVLVFNTQDARITGLTAGQVLVLEDLGARRVLGTVRQGPLTAVATNAAALVDFIQDGTIQFPNNSHDPTILDQQDTNFGPGMDHLSGTVDEWQYTASSDAGGADANDLDFSFDAQKHLSGFDANVKGEGHLKNSGFSFMTDIHGAKVQKLFFTAPVEGTLKVDWAARTSGANSGIGERRLRLPAFFKEIFVANHLPFLYEISANMIFIPGLGGKKDAVSGGFQVAYKGKGGFTATAKDSAPVKQMEASPQSVEKVSSSALAPHGIVLAMNAPKIAISFGTTSFMEAVHSSVPAAIKNSRSADGFESQLSKFLSKDSADFFRTEGGAYVQWVDEYDYTGSGPMSVVPNCTTTHFNLIASGGVDAKLLGLDGKGTFDLYKSESSKTEPDIAGCRVAK
jgi:hypothetical protein